jgi:O-methyltransferase/methyltransferase family protein
MECEMSQTGKKVGTVRLQNLSYAHKQAAVLMAAVELDLFTHVSRGSSRLPELAEALTISEVNAERLLVACSALDLIVKSGDIYENAPDVERFLVKDKPTYIGPWMLFPLMDFEKWRDLGAALKSSDRPKTLGLYETLTDEMAVEYHNATYSVGLGAGMLFARDVDMSNRSLILDLGGGSGAYCIAAVQKYPHLQAVVLDFETVCKVTDRFIAEWGMSDSITTHPGDFTRDQLPQGADLMIMASNLPQYSDGMLIQIMTKAYNSLKPGGEFHLVGETLNDEKTGPLGPALWGVHEALFGSEGRSHSESEVRHYLETAGFSDISVNEFIPGSLSRITGTKY